MKGNKGQSGYNWIGMSVLLKRKKILCTIISIMTDEEYEKSNQDYKHYYSLKDSQGNIIQCGRSDFLIQKK